MSNKLLKFFATGAYISYIPTAILKGKKNTGAGLLGTFEAFLLVVFFMPKNYWAYALVLAVFTAFSVYVSDKVDFGDGKKDDPKIVIDEIAGYFFAMLFLPQTATMLILAFVLFRIFDTTKIGFIRKLENFDFGKSSKKFPSAGLAVVLDDVAAGVISNLLIRVMLFLNIITL